MALNKVKAGSNMYQFITHTWNPIRGECYHGCSYCYMHRMWNRFPEMKELKFVEKEMSTSLGKDKYIFIGSSTDMWTDKIPDIWLDHVIEHCLKFDNKYFIQTKNPKRFFDYILTYSDNLRKAIFDKFSFCITLESDIQYIEMGATMSPQKRVDEFSKLNFKEQYVTIEPIMKFSSVDNFVRLIRKLNPVQINIGADSGNNLLPEPTGDEIRELIIELEKFTKVKQKDNLKRLLK